jgi:hypothetical protein
MQFALSLKTQRHYYYLRDSFGSRLNETQRDEEIRFLSSVVIITAFICRTAVVVSSHLNKQQRSFEATLRTSLASSSFVPGLPVCLDQLGKNTIPVIPTIVNIIILCKA